MWEFSKKKDNKTTTRRDGVIGTWIENTNNDWFVVDGHHLSVSVVLLHSIETNDITCANINASIVARHYLKYLSADVKKYSLIKSAAGHTQDFSRYRESRQYFRIYLVKMINETRSTKKKENEVWLFHHQLTQMHRCKFLFCFISIPYSSRSRIGVRLILNFPSRTCWRICCVDIRWRAFTWITTSNQERRDDCNQYD